MATLGRNAPDRRQGIQQQHNRGHGVTLFATDDRAAAFGCGHRLRCVELIALSVATGEAGEQLLADLFVEGVPLVELKTIKALDDAGCIQWTNYFVYFCNSRLEIKRVVHDP